MMARLQMLKPIACLLAFSMPFLVGRVAEARDLGIWSATVVCMQSMDESQADQPLPVHSLCLLRLAPLFSRTSVDITPLARMSFSRWGGQLELRF